jgi:hypothetical protein
MTSILCHHCDWAYLILDGTAPKYCPHCWRAALAPVEETALPTQPPELVVPFDMTAAELAQGLQTFASGIPSAPHDLSAENLSKRLQPLYLPMYLVDSDVQATWQGEAGFNYDVVSHQERYGGTGASTSGWQTQQVKETRIRWEPRAGRLHRTYHNIAAPALEEDARLKHDLGEFDLSVVQPYAVGSVPVPGGTPLFRLPNRTTHDAWPDAIPNIQTAASNECRQAGQSDHFREFRWQAEYANLNWCQLLLPIYATYYLDDDQRPQPVLIHGRTGHMSGARRASMKRAQTTALYILLGAAVMFGLSVLLALVGVVFPPLIIAGGVGVFMAFIVALGAIVPVFRAWQFNRSRS